VSSETSGVEDEGRFGGRSMERREDPRLLSGDARYADDISYPGQTHLAILRSRYGHARIGDVDTSAAEALSGVIAVYTAEDLLESGIENALPGDDPDSGSPAKRPILAAGKARYQGDPVAGVVAEDRYTASEAVDLIEVEYERLDAVPDIHDATADDAPTIHGHAPDNVAFEWEGGDREATEASFETADRVVEVDLEINKVIAVPMEPRAAVARYRPSDDHLTVELSCQNVLSNQDNLSAILGVPEHRISVKAPDVGGAFGAKNVQYAGSVLAAWCAMRHERPVRWRATRTEEYASMIHAREQEARMARVAKGTYRPCYNNSTFFQDCNHGSALLGLLQLAASQGLTEDELYEEALAFNAFWFPHIYVQTALYFKVVEGVDWADVDPRIVMGARYSALGPWQATVGAQLARIPNLLPQQEDGASCGA
jgi:CO/xanthine dehydrogenase Mo-binding subunit